MTKTNNALVDEYLDRLARATAGLPPERREELIRDLREHIDAERAELADENEAAIRQILERLGDPEMIAREAAADAEPVPPAAARPRMNRTVLRVILAVAAVLVVLAVCGAVVLLGHSTVAGTARPA